LIGFSVGVAFALRYAQDHPDSIAGLVIQDWPAHYRAQTTEWMENATAKQLGSEHIGAIQRESTTVDLWDGLGKLKCPVLIMRGGLSDSRLSHQDAQRYQGLLPQAQLVVFENAGHYVWHPDYEGFLAHISGFLETLDAAGEN
jgi:pimeloyl-ACP methyl ester carboxylesterase